MSEENRVPEAIDILRKALMSDPQYYDVWKSNITMAFLDEYFREYGSKPLPRIAELAAMRFIDKLCATREDQPTILSV